MDSPSDLLQIAVDKLGTQIESNNIVESPEISPQIEEKSDDDLEDELEINEVLELVSGHIKYLQMHVNEALEQWDTESCFDEVEEIHELLGEGIEFGEDDYMFYREVGDEIVEVAQKSDWSIETVNLSNLTLTYLAVPNTVEDEILNLCVKYTISTFFRLSLNYKKGNQYIFLYFLSERQKLSYQMRIIWIRKKW